MIIYDDYNLPTELQEETEIINYNDNQWMDAEYIFEELNKQAEQFLMIGSCGLWNGRVNGGKILNNLMDFTQYTFDYTIIELKENTGEIRIETHHHDGVNNYTIKPISKRGETFIDNHYYNLTDEELHNKLYNTRGLTKKFNLKDFT